MEETACRAAPRRTNTGLSDLLTSLEAAHYLRISNGTLENKRVDGTGPRYFKVGPGKRAKVVYRLADLDEWLKKHSFGSTSEY